MSFGLSANNLFKGMLQKNGQVGPNYKRFYSNIQIRKIRQLRKMTAIH